MKRTFTLILGLAFVLAFTAGSLSAGVVKQSKAQITFKGFGTFTTTSADKVTAERKLAEITSNFKGKGLVGGLAAKTLLRSGTSAEITDLPALTVYKIDHKKKEYTATPIEKMKETAGGEGEPEGKPEERQKPEENPVKITRSEFKVEKTDETRDINQFPCQKYVVTWLVEWENTQTGEKGQDTLLTDVWTTPFSGDIKAALNEESAFSRAYLKAIGIDAEQMQRDVLGTSWLNMLQAMNPTGGASKFDASKTAKEMRKLEGYPIVVDGKYKVARQGGPKQEEAAAEEEKPRGLGGLLGKAASKALTKKDKAPAGDEPTLAYYTEVVSLSVGGVDEGTFQVPAGYKKKG